MRTEAGLAKGVVGVAPILLGPAVPGDLNPLDGGVRFGNPLSGAKEQNKVKRSKLFKLIYRQKYFV